MILVAMLWCFIQTLWVLFQLCFLVTGVTAALLAVLSLSADTCRIGTKLLGRRRLERDDFRTWVGLSHGFPEVTEVLRREVDVFSHALACWLDETQRRWLAQRQPQAI